MTDVRKGNLMANGVWQYAITCELPGPGVSQRAMKMAPCPATNGSWQVPEVLGDGGLGEGPSFKKGLPPKKCIYIGTPIITRTKRYFS